MDEVENILGQPLGNGARVGARFAVVSRQVGKGNENPCSELSWEWLRHDRTPRSRVVRVRRPLLVWHHCDPAKSLHSLARSMRPGAGCSWSSPWGIEGRRPDPLEWIGAAISLLGVSVMLWKEALIGTEGKGQYAYKVQKILAHRGVRELKLCRGFFRPS